MNWCNLINLIDLTVLGTLAIGVTPVILKVVGKIQEVWHKDHQLEEQPIQIGQMVKLVIEDPMACEKYEILEERMDLYTEQIISYNAMVESLERDLDSEFNIDRITKIQLAITNMKMKINMTKDKCDKITQEIEDLVLQYGIPTSISK